MHVVVIGGTGNVGLALVRALDADARIERVTAVSRRPTSALPPSVVSVAADIAHDDLAPVVRGADAVVHLAWLIQPSRSLDAQRQVNVDGTARVLAAVAAERVPTLVCASSVGAYSPRTSLTPVDEHHPTHGIATSAYSRQKAYVERMLDDFEARHRDVRVVRLRPALVFQAEAAAAQRRYFAGPLLPRRLLRPGVLPLVPHLHGVHVQAVHADDLADAYLRAITSDARGAFNITSPEVLSTTDIADLLEARTVRVPLSVARRWIDLAWRARLHPLEAGWIDLATKSPVMDAGRARDELGWRPRHTGRDALREVLLGIAGGAAGPTPPLASRAAPAEVLDGLRTGMGARGSTDPRAVEPPR